MIAALADWGWLILGLVLLALELVVPGVFLIWFGAAAIIVALNGLFFDWPWQAEIAAFAVLALAFVLLARRYFAGGEASDQPLLNQRGSRFVGQTFVLAEPIVAGAGRVAVDDTVWRVVGPDCAAGTKVRVTGIDGATLKVEADDSKN